MDKILMLLKLLPAIITAVKAIEEAVEGAGLGAQKLEAIRQILELADGSIKPLWSMIEASIKILVGLFNSVGVFKK